MGIVRVHFATTQTFEKTCRRAAASARSEGAAGVEVFGADRNILYSCRFGKAPSDNPEARFRIDFERVAINMIFAAAGCLYGFIFYKHLPVPFGGSETLLMAIAAGVTLSLRFAGSGTLF